jgi:tRNA1(Val) A37 N6-methylase TrmN6
MRVPGVDILGIEIDPALVELARDNADRNGMAGRVRFDTGDIAKFAEEGGFDHVFFNPPFYPASGQESPHAARDRAMRDADQAISAWMQAALLSLKDHGTVTAIVRADRTLELLSAAEGWAATLFSLFPHAGEEPKRVIVQVVKGTSGHLRDAAGLVLHEANGRNTEAAEAVLRHGAALRLD